MSDAEPNLPFQPGELIAEKYRVERLLGAGGMGVVVEATHVDLERKVAVKLIREEVMGEGSTVERLMLEAKAAAKIRSEHVGKVLDVGKLPSGAPYIVMEYLEGQDLCQLLETRGALEITRAVDYVMQASEALAEAHAASIVHRDLKPENLFVARQPDGSHIIKVLDFGISKQLGAAERRQLTNPSTAVGSPRYMAPEQMQGLPIDVRADLWSLGAILYECLSNRPAFDADTLPGICAQVLSQDPRPLEELAPHVPARLTDIIVRCLDKDRERRFGNIAELAQALAPFGTDRAELSRRRVAALLGGGSSIAATQALEPAALVDTRGQTLIAESSGLLSQARHQTTLGRGMALDVAARTASPEQPRVARSRWPFVAGGLALAGLVAGVAFALTNGPDAEPEAAVASAPDAPPLDAPPFDALPPTTPTNPGDAEPTASARAEEPAAPTVSLELDEPDPAASVQPSASATANESPAVPRPPKGPPRKATRPEPPKEAPKEPAQRRPTDAWDPNNFGGRE